MNSREPGTQSHVTYVTMTSWQCQKISTSLTLSLLCTGWCQSCGIRYWSLSFFTLKNWGYESGN